MNFPEHLSYLGIFLWFAFFEQITPIPEEISLITIGYMSTHAKLDPWLCGILAAAGLTCVDNLFFYLTAKGKKLTKNMSARLNTSFIIKFKTKIKSKPAQTLMIMALIPKLRFMSPIVSASSGIPWRTFFIINTSMTIVYVSFYFLVGIFFHDKLKSVFKELEMARHGFFALIVMTTLIFIIRFSNKRMKDL